MHGEGSTCNEECRESGHGFRRLPTDLDGATAPPEPNVMAATPGEFAAVWNTLTEEQRVGFLAALRAADDVAMHCRLRHVKPTQHGSIDQLVRDAEAGDR